MENLLQILQYYNLDENDIKLIQTIAKSKNIKTHKTLIDYGEKCQNIYFVLKGGFVLKFLNEITGNERTINFNLDSFQPFMTVPQSYFNNIPSNCKIQAIKNSDVLVFEKNRLLEIVNLSERIKDFYYQQIINALLLELDFRMKLITYSPQEIYELLISDYTEIVKNIPSKDIASFIGISPEWLSNLKQKLNS
jgi:CRP/FNR family transcriptional regulator